jgi:hypothetical protein
MARALALPSFHVNVLSVRILGYGMVIEVGIAPLQSQSNQYIHVRTQVCLTHPPWRPPPPILDREDGLDWCRSPELP